MTTEEILWAVVVMLLGTLGGLLKYFVSTNNKRIEGVETENKEIKSNYIKKFDDLQTHQTQNKIEVIKEINELRVLIASIKNEV